MSVVNTNTVAASDLSPVTFASNYERGDFTIFYMATVASLGFEAAKSSRSHAWFAAEAICEALCAVYGEHNVLVTISMVPVVASCFGRRPSQVGGCAIGADGGSDTDESDVVTGIGDAARDAWILASWLEAHEEEMAA